MYSFKLFTAFLSGLVVSLVVGSVTLIGLSHPSTQPLFIMFLVTIGGAFILAGLHQMYKIGKFLCEYFYDWFF